MKIAFSGTSGSGKTTLVKWVEKEFGIPHISGSAGDIRTERDTELLNSILTVNGITPTDGHAGVIINSAKCWKYGISFQETVRMRRHEIIVGTHPKYKSPNLVTDRSPIDNIVYYLSQVGFHHVVDDDDVKRFLDKCLITWAQLDYVIYVKSCQPDGVEYNGSRVANLYYQKSIDAAFNYWFEYFVKNTGEVGPKVLKIDFWDLDMRKNLLKTFLTPTENA